MLCLFLFVSLPVEVCAQFKDKLYLVDETAIAEIDILQVDDKKVKYRNKEGKDYSHSTKHVLLAFTSHGKFLTFPNSAEQAANFLTPEERPSAHDVIVTMSEQVISGDIHLENEFEIDFHDLLTDEKSKRLSTTELVAIVYKDGRHKLFTSPSQSSNILNLLKEEVAVSRQTSYQKPVLESQLLLAFNETGKEETKEEEAVVPPPAENLAAAPVIDFELYQQKALQKTADLGTYLGIISDRNNDLAKANKAVELALRLFVNESAQVEVSGKTTKNRYEIRNYLNRLKLLKYDKIEVSWSDISYVSELKKGVDGNYYGIITLQQRFSGFMDGRKVYSDLTEKNVEVILKAYQKEKDGEKQEMWDVFLSDIGVVVTNFD